MTINLIALGSKLSRYREQLQLSTEEVSLAIRISPDRLRSVEAGTLEPSGDEVLMLADLYRCDFKFFISNEQLAPFEQTDILYRKHGSEFTKEDRRAIQEFLYLCETEHFLMEELNATHREFSAPQYRDISRPTGLKRLRLSAASISTRAMKFQGMFTGKSAKQACMCFATS
ncbi:helix-turn-helix domain-containing protein [Pseudomonas aeruginosa]